MSNYVRPRNVAVVSAAADTGPVVYAAPLPQGPVTVLQGVTAVVFEATAGREAEPDELAPVVAKELGVSEQDIDTEVLAELLEELAGFGLLRRVSR